MSNFDTIYIVLKAQIPNNLEQMSELLTKKYFHLQVRELLQPIKDWLDRIEIKDIRLARLICTIIPAQCPFERDIKLFGRQIAHIPPLCKLNPFYDQLVFLRFRSLSYLADECHVNISKYV